jgi:hypothetical protein
MISKSMELRSSVVAAVAGNKLFELPNYKVTPHKRKFLMGLIEKQ